MSYYYSRKRERPPQQPASPQRAGYYAGLHDESQPFYSGNLTQKQTRGHHHPVQRLERLQVEIDETEAEGTGRIRHPQRSASRQTRRQGGLTWFCILKTRHTYLLTTAQSL